MRASAPLKESLALYIAQRPESGTRASTRFMGLLVLHLIERQALPLDHPDVLALLHGATTSADDARGLQPLTRLLANYVATRAPQETPARPAIVQALHAISQTHKGKAWGALQDLCRGPMTTEQELGETLIALASTMTPEKPSTRYNQVRHQVIGDAKATPPQTESATLQQVQALPRAARWEMSNALLNVLPSSRSNALTAAADALLWDMPTAQLWIADVLADPEAAQERWMRGWKALVSTYQQTTDRAYASMGSPAKLRIAINDTKDLGHIINPSIKRLARNTNVEYEDVAPLGDQWVKLYLRDVEMADTSRRRDTASPAAQTPFPRSR
jgi:hypothetical protein